MRLVLIVHDIRSCHNVGSLLRTAEGLGVDHVYLTGYTPYPALKNDSRLPHLSAKIHKQIHKTALGAEDMIKWSHHEHLIALITELKAKQYQLVGLEQTMSSVQLAEFKPSNNTALLLGREVEGIEPTLLTLCDKTVEIPMKGKKESFNVVQAAAMALYHCQFMRRG